MSYSERFARTEAALAALNDVVALIVKQLDTVQSKSRTPVPCDMPHTPSKSPNPSPTHFAKPATPDDFAGDRDKGRAFLNSCNLYFALAPHRFPDDVTRILWVLSFMKSDRAALFVDRSLRTYRISGRLPFESWLEFSTAFVTEFCPKNEVQVARTILESSEYFQGHRNVEEYVDEFRDLVQRANYFEAAHIVLKFRRGLNPQIQDHIACLIIERPSDESPKEWYDAAILCDENRIMNEIFTNA